MAEEGIEENQEVEEETVQEIVRVEDIAPIEYTELYNGILSRFVNGELGYTNEQTNTILEKHFGKDIAGKKLSGKKYQAKWVALASEVFKQTMHDIKIKGTSLHGENINSAAVDMLKVINVNGLDLSSTPIVTFNAVLKRRCGYIKELDDTRKVLELGRRLFDAYVDGSVSPEINEDVLKMEDFRRNGVIDREVLANYYHNLALVYERSSSQSGKQTERTRSINYMKKALETTDSSIELVMTLKDSLADNPGYVQQDVLDAFHRIMDSNTDNKTLCLAHKLYAETLSEDTSIKGFSSHNHTAKILKHYNHALEYAESVEDKLDILGTIASRQKNVDKSGYVNTMFKMADLQSGRKRIRTLKHLATVVDDPKLKAEVLLGAVNEYYEVLDSDKISGEDVATYNSIDAKLRQITKDSATIKQLDTLQGLLKKEVEKGRSKSPESSEKQDIVFSRASSKGRDVFKSTPIVIKGFSQDR